MAWEHLSVSISFPLFVRLHRSDSDEKEASPSFSLFFFFFFFLLFFLFVCCYFVRLVLEPKISVRRISARRMHSVGCTGRGGLISTGDFLGSRAKALVFAVHGDPESSSTGPSILSSDCCRFILAICLLGSGHLRVAFDRRCLAWGRAVLL